jgi:1-acyl-sn-glycerol-3-phosphate acyltransferase
LIRSIWALLFGTVSTAYYASRVLVAMATGSKKLWTLGHAVPTAWSKSILWASGVKVEAEGLEVLEGNQPRVLVANHESWFDVFALCAVIPSAFRFVGKQELEKVPLLGPAWVGSGHLAIDRGDRNSAVDTLREATTRMHESGLTIVMFPEGTRSPDQELQRFKKGSFVLALQAQCPIVPVGIEGSGRIMPKGSFRIRSGTIRVRVGTPISTEGLTMESRDRLLEESRVAVAELRGAANSSAEGGTGHGSTRRGSTDDV